MPWLPLVLLLVVAILVLTIALTITARRRRAARSGLIAPARLVTPEGTDVSGAAIRPDTPIGTLESIAPEAPGLVTAPDAPPPYPIVLVHGFLGFGEIQVFGRRYQYFRGVAEAIAETGAPVHIVTLPPVASVEQRARVLAEAVRALGVPRVHLVAHSMGGIDARYAIARLGLAGCVASLVTIGTPHHGTPLARLGSLPPMGSLWRAFARAGFDAGAIDALTPERMARFNEEIPDHADVYYASVVSSVRWRSTHPALWTGHVLMGFRAGTSDGVVPVASQRWGEVLTELDVDHWAQIGWSQSFDARQLYRDIAQRLRARELSHVITSWSDTIVLTDAPGLERAG